MVAALWSARIRSGLLALHSNTTGSTNVAEGFAGGLEVLIDSTGSPRHGVDATQQSFRYVATRFATIQFMALDAIRDRRKLHLAATNFFETSAGAICANRR